MSDRRPPNADSVRQLVEERLNALDGTEGIRETLTVEWRGHQRSLPVISMPVELLTYNPDTHRVKAQRSLDPARDRDLTAEPFGSVGQAYLHDLLRGDPAAPSNTDPAFVALQEDLAQHGQSDPGLITRDGVLINGNTRRAALKVLGSEHIRVGVLPADAGPGDRQAIELSMQLRKDHRRDYSFVNLLLAIDERVTAGRPAADVQSDFRMKPATYERNRWLLDFIREAIERSQVTGLDGQPVKMRLVDFESHQGKLEELHRAYSALKAKRPDEAEALREQRLLAVALGSSKTDIRLIEADFTERYMPNVLPDTLPAPTPRIDIPGMPGVTAAAPSPKATALRALTDQVLRARAVELAPGAVPVDQLTKANDTLKALDKALDDGLTQAGKNARLNKKRFEPADRLSDANEDLAAAVGAVAAARSAGTFDPDDLEESLRALKGHVTKLAQLASRSSTDTGEGLAWLQAAAAVPESSS